MKSKNYFGLANILYFAKGWGKTGQLFVDCKALKTEKKCRLSII